MNTSGTNCWGEQFGDDAWGNLDSRTLPSSYSSGCKYETPFSYSIGNNNQLPSGSGFTYDAVGNLMKTGSANYAYNGDEQMTSVTAGGTTTYSYDGDGRRVEKSGGTIYWYGMSSAALDETVICPVVCTEDHTTFESPEFIASASGFGPNGGAQGAFILVRAQACCSRWVR